MNRTYRMTTVAGLGLLLFTYLCRYSKSMADVYATMVYPTLSGVLSWISSFTSYNLQEFAVLVIVITALSIVVMGIGGRWGVWRCVRYEATLVMWTYVWFYMGWCVNYMRSNLYVRSGAECVAKYDEERFLCFTHRFAEGINEAWVNVPADVNMTDSIYDTRVLEEEIKEFYSSVPSHYGLATPHRWQHPKRIICNRLYSCVGVLGFMAPLFSESCLNADIQPYDYPFVYAHEYAHLLGVSGEAEANWWAFHACAGSEDVKVRYSAFKGILPHVLINARGLLSEEQFTALQSSLRPEVIRDLKETHEHWRALRSPALDAIQSKIYDSFLKSNDVKAGLQNYTQVIELLINIKYEEQKNKRTI